MEDVAGSPVLESTGSTARGAAVTANLLLWVKLESRSRSGKFEFFFRVFTSTSVDLEKNKKLT